MSKQHRFWVSAAIVVLIVAVRANGQTTPVQSDPQSSHSDRTRAEQRYRWKSRDDLVGVLFAEAITVTEVVINGQRYRDVLFHEGGKIAMIGDEKLLDLPGSRDIRIAIDAAAKETTYAGLTLTTPCILEILDDGSLLADRQGIVARDDHGKAWHSEKLTLQNRTVFAFFPASTGAVSTSTTPRSVSSGRVASSPQRSGQEKPIDLTLRVPSDAAVELEGVKVPGTGEVRRFRTPPVEPGKDYKYRLRAEWTVDQSLRIVERTLIVRAGETIETDLRRPEDWPKYRGELSGWQEFRLVNNGSRRVTVGLRSGGRGKDFAVGANSTAAVNVPSGAYEVFFQFIDEPENTYEGDRLTIQSGVAGVQITLGANSGNYNIRRKGWRSLVPLPLTAPTPVPIPKSAPGF